MEPSVQCVSSGNHSISKVSSSQVGAVLSRLLFRVSNNAIKKSFLLQWAKKYKNSAIKILSQHRSASGFIFHDSYSEFCVISTECISPQKWLIFLLASDWLIISVIPIVSSAWFPQKIFPKNIGNVCILWLHDSHS